MMKNYLKLLKCCCIILGAVAANDIIDSDQFTNLILVSVLNRTNASSNFLIAPQIVQELYLQLTEDKSAKTEDNDVSDADNKAEEKFNIPTTQPIKVAYTLYANASKNSKQIEELMQSFEKLNLTFINIRHVSQQQQDHEEDATQSAVMKLLHAVVTVNQRWVFNFQNRDTHKELFYNTPPQRNLYMDAMHKEDVFPYAILPHLDASALQLAVHGKQNSMKMLILLPKQRTGLRQLLQALIPNTTRIINEIVDDLKMTSLRLMMPKFRIESKTNLNNIFMEMSNTTLFSNLHVPTLDFNIIHEASLEANEDGIGNFEHSTVLFWNTYSSLITPRAEFNMKHPFVFIIHHMGHIKLFGYLSEFCC